MEVKYIIGAKSANKLCEAVKAALVAEIDAAEQDMSYDYWAARVRVIGDEQAAKFPKCDKIYVQAFNMARDGRGIALYSNHNAYTQSKGSFLTILYCNTAEPPTPEGSDDEEAEPAAPEGSDDKEAEDVPFLGINDENKDLPY